MKEGECTEWKSGKERGDVEFKRVGEGVLWIWTGYQSTPIVILFTIVWKRDNDAQLVPAITLSTAG